MDRHPDVQSVRLRRTGGVHTLQVRTDHEVKVFVGPRSDLVARVEDLVADNGLEQVRPDLWTARRR